ncbi:MAG: DUF2088 domain-containing protein [Chloroflexi bacterium]|nr:DUF2088 domain-containing protein [Chloroflexota bacterium]
MNKGDQEKHTSRFPRMALVRQRLSVDRIENVPGVVKDQLARLHLDELIQPGMRVAVTAGSRGIANIATVLATTISQLKAHGAEPFVIPAMGCHGGAVAGVQAEILHSLGITEAAVGCPIISSLDVVCIGETPQGIPVFIDRTAAQADGIVVINRIKPHTDFVGEIESGLMKMMAIGLGKYVGALNVHSHGIRLGLAVAIPAVARVVLSRCRILFGIALIENAYHQLAQVVAIPSTAIEETEKTLLPEARRMMGHLPFDELDILIVDEMGKEISGTGMDTKVIGRIRMAGSAEPDAPRIRRIVVRDLTDATHGNAIGIGLADFTTRRLVDKIDYHSTYINAVTAMCPERGYLPVVAETDREAIEYALITIGAVDPQKSRVVRVANTLELEHFYVSESLLAQIGDRIDMEQISELEPLSFDEKGMLLSGPGHTGF